MISSVATAYAASDLCTLLITKYTPHRKVSMVHESNIESKLTLMKLQPPPHLTLTKLMELAKCGDITPKDTYTIVMHFRAELHICTVTKAEPETSLL